jgi:hypothetical protein
MFLNRQKHKFFPTLKDKIFIPGLNKFQKSFIKTSTNLPARKDEELINVFYNHIKKFKAKNFQIQDDFLLVDSKTLPKKLSANDTYIIFKSENKPYIELLLFILLSGLCTWFFYLNFKGIIISIKSKKKPFTFSRIFKLSSACLFAVYLFYLKRIHFWKYVKQIELSKDLEHLIFRNSFSQKKIIKTKIDSVFFFHEQKYMELPLVNEKDLLVIGLGEEKKEVLLSIKTCYIPDKDLLAASLRGYKLKKKL